MTHPLKWTVAATLALTMAACGGENRGDGPEQPSNQTIAQALDGDLSGLGAAVETAGLTEAMRGVGPYTVFAPVNDALPEDFDDAEGPEAAALLRAHIAPGMMTRADIRTAIDAADGGQVQIRTMDEGLLTFTRDGETLVITSDDGASARLTGDEELVENGAIQPVDAVLIRQEG